MTYFPDRALYAGVPNALSAFLATYEHCSRRSGRTTAMVAALRDGDTVIFATEKEAMRAARLALDRGAHIRAVVVAVGKFDPGLFAQEGRRILFDHGWLTAYWSHVIAEGSAKFWECNDLYNPPFQEVAGTPKNY